MKDYNILQNRTNFYILKFVYFSTNNKKFKNF